MKRATKPRTQTVKASRPEKMIEIRIRFFTNITKKSGHVVPKHAWSGGTVRMEKNDTHGIVTRQARRFRSLLDLSTAIEKTLLDHSVVIHPSAQMARYLSTR
jgi:hypothetical protein